MLIPLAAIGLTLGIRRPTVVVIVMSLLAEQAPAVPP